MVKFSPSFLIQLFFPARSLTPCAPGILIDLCHLRSYFFSSPRKTLGFHTPAEALAKLLCEHSSRKAVASAP